MSGSKPIQGFAKCILCRSHKSIDNSHVIPKFVFRWMTSTGGVPYLRFAETPNRRVQDGLKLPLLCSECEGKIGKLEKSFSERVFMPSVNDERLPKRLGAIDYSFICSLHFRAIGYNIKNSEHPDYYDIEEKRLIVKAFGKMRRHLIGTAASVYPFKFFLLPIGLGQLSSFSGLPTNWNRFIKRQAEIDIFSSENKTLLGSYVKFGPWVSICLMQNKGEPWTIDELSISSKKMYSRNELWPETIFEFLEHRARQSQDLMKQISNKQLLVIEDAVKKADFLVAGRQMFDALSADYEAFGPEAFKPD